MTFVYENWLLIAVAFVSGAMLVWPLVQRRFSPMRSIGVAEMTRLINARDALPLDVRDAKEFAAGRLPNAINIPLSDLDKRTADLAKHAAKPVVAYCDVGNRSRAAGTALAKAGVADIYHLNGGFRAWKDAGLPVEKSR
ncbi:MAG TPA: rhodanese-like domain-containing protein [Casimicrobiaceae bacterium]|nr:rhodanese-like domain-containing protein [Casimicrobiaceae bacterium]